MSTRVSGPDGPTRIERERRAQIVSAAIELVAERGYVSASLARIADAAGVVKGTVVYHFATKDAVLDAAYQHVLSALVNYVGAEVEAVSATEAPSAYVRSMVGYLTANPAHAHTLVQVGLASAVDHDSDHIPTSARWAPLAEMLASARGVGDASRLRTTAILIGGMIDAVVSEFLDDPTYDAAAAAEQILVMMAAT